jgi:Na+-translocating ferredoxin:NAD+ oxidoreductase RnfE subunit
MGPLILGNGWIIANTDLVFKNLWTVLTMKVSSTKVRSMVMVNSNGQIIHITKVLLSIIKCGEKVDL